jgi:hypothetical protein
MFNPYCSLIVGGDYVLAQMTASVDTCLLEFFEYNQEVGRIDLVNTSMITVIYL